MDDTYKNQDNKNSKQTINMPVFIRKRGGLFRLIYLLLFIFFTILCIILIITRTIAINSYKTEKNKLNELKIQFNNLTITYKNQQEIIERYYLEHTYRIEELQKENVTLQSKLTDLKDENEELEKKNTGIKNSNKNLKEVINENNERKEELDEKIKDMKDANKKIQKMIDDLKDY